jgi:hypothetical protein
MIYREKQILYIHYVPLHKNDANPGNHDVAAGVGTAAAGVCTCICTAGTAGTAGTATTVGTAGTAGTSTSTNDDSDAAASTTPLRSRATRSSKCGFAIGHRRNNRS